MKRPPYLECSDPLSVFRESPELVEGVLSNLLQGVLVCDEKRRVLYTSPSFERITGYTRQEMLGRSCAILQGRETDPLMVRKLRDALEAGEPFEGEILNYRKDGTPFWNQLSISAVRDRSGRVTRYVGFQQDISQRRLQEQRLRKLSQDLLAETTRLSESQAVAGIGSWQTDLSTLEVTWTDETFRIFDSVPGSFTPTHEKFLSFVHPEDRQRVDDAFVASVGDLGRHSIQHRLLLAGGRVRHVEECWQVFVNAAGAATHAVGTCQGG